jgi:hypothetical protein
MQATTASARRLMIAAPFGRAPAEHGPGFEGRCVQPGETCRSAVGDEDFAVVGDGAGHAWKSRQRCFVFACLVINHFDSVARGVRDENTPGFGIKCGVIEGAARSTRYLDDSTTLQRHSDLASQG